MKTSQEKLKAGFLAQAEALFDQLLEWDEQTCEPDLTQIEEIVLQLRQRFGEQMAIQIIKVLPLIRLRISLINKKTELLILLRNWDLKGRDG